MEVEAEDVTELLQSHEELSAEDLMELEKQVLADEQDDSAQEPKNLTSRGLPQAFH